jgi:hypothetical protein
VRRRKHRHISASAEEGCAETVKKGAFFDEKPSLSGVFGPKNPVFRGVLFTVKITVFLVEDSVRY